MKRECTLKTLKSWPPWRSFAKPSFVRPLFNPSTGSRTLIVEFIALDFTTQRNTRPRQTPDLKKFTWPLTFLAFRFIWKFVALSWSVRSSIGYDESVLSQRTRRRPYSSRTSICVTFDNGWTRMGVAFALEWGLRSETYIPLSVP